MTLQPRPLSPRTPDAPMAFTKDELLRGALTAWIIFMTILLAGTTLVFGVSALLPGWSSSAAAAIPLILVADGYVLLIGGSISGIVMAFGLLLVRPLASRLGRVSSLRVHLLVYIGIGAAIGVVYTVLVRGAGQPGPLSPLDAFYLLPAAAVTVSVPLAWWLSFRRAQRMDADLNRTRPARRDQDAVAEDAAIDL